jgi:hypothetical protein
LQAIEKGDMETAKIYANNAIREKNQALNFLRLSSRIDAVSQRVQTAVSMGQLTKSMGSTVKGLDKVLATMNVEKISKVRWINSYVGSLCSTYMCVCLCVVLERERVRERPSSCSTCTIWWPSCCTV